VKRVWATTKSEVGLPGFGLITLALWTLALLRMSFCPFRVRLQEIECATTTATSFGVYVAGSQEWTTVLWGELTNDSKWTAYFCFSHAR
jgi:hypothetical protein